MRQPTLSTHSPMRAASGPIHAAALLTTTYPGLPVDSIAINASWGVTVYLHHAAASDFDQWVDALGLTAEEPRTVRGKRPFQVLAARGEFAEVKVDVRVYVDVPAEAALPVRGGVDAVEVALLGLWLDTYGDRQVWSEELRLAYAAAIAKARQNSRQGAA